MVYLNARTLINAYALLIVFAAIAWSTPAADQTANAGIEVTNCEVQCIEEVAVPALKSGPLVNVLVQVNEEVGSGKVIAVIDDRPLQLQRQAAKLERDAAAERTADDVELQFALTTQREADEELHATQDVLRKTPGVVTEANLRRLRLAAERAALEVEQSRKARRIAEIALSIRSAELQAIDEQFQRLQVKSPINGVVRELFRRSGEWTAEGETIAKLARLDRLRVDALVDAKSLDPSRCRNCRVSVSWEHLGESKSLHGRITSIDPQMYAGSQWRIHAEIINAQDQAGWKLLPGMEVRMTIYPGPPWSFRDDDIRCIRSHEANIENRSTVVAAMARGETLVDNPRSH